MKTTLHKILIHSNQVISSAIFPIGQLYEDAQEARYYITNWLSRNPEVHYRPYLSPPLVPIFSKSYPISRITTHLPEIHLILSSHLRLGVPKGLLLSGFPTKTLYAFLDWSIRATCPAHLSRLDLRFLIGLFQGFVTVSFLR